MACASCHAQTVVTCNSCHFESEINGDGKVFPKPPKTGWMMLANRLKRDGSGETEVYPANFQSVKYTTATFDSTTYVAFGFFTPHSIGTGRTCSDCHNNMGGTNEAIVEYNATGQISMSVFNAATQKIDNPDGVVPIPEDYLQSLYYEFADTDDVGATFQFYKAGADTIRIPTQWVTPLSFDQMSALGMTPPPAP